MSGHSQGDCNTQFLAGVDRAGPTSLKFSKTQQLGPAGAFTFNEWVGEQRAMLDFISRKFEEGGQEIMSAITFVAFLSIVIIIERAYRYWLQYDLANSSGFMAAVQKMVMNNS